MLLGCWDVCSCRLSRNACRRRHSIWPASSWLWSRTVEQPGQHCKKQRHACSWSLAALATSGWMKAVRATPGCSHARSFSATAVYPWPSLQAAVHRANMCRWELLAAAQLDQALVQGQSRLPGDSTHPRLVFLLPQVVAATRIHNRHLRAQFGKHWQQGDAFEYLFFTDPAGAPPPIKAIALLLYAPLRHCLKRFQTFKQLSESQPALPSSLQSTPAGPLAGSTPLPLCLHCVATSAADLMSIAQHGFSTLHSSCSTRPGVKLASHLSLTGKPSSQATSAGSTPGSPVQVLVCRACLKGPCKALPETGEQTKLHLASQLHGCWVANMPGCKTQGTRMGTWG